MNLFKRISCRPFLLLPAALAILGAPRPGCAGIPQLIANIPPGHWIEVPDSKMTRIFYNGPLASQIHGVTGPNTIVNAWSGGTLDTKRNRLVIWGGGHTDYAGNEVYAFNLNTLKWERLSDPSSIAGYDGKSGEYPDGTPASTHTYDAITYLPDPYDGLFVSMLPAIFQTGSASLVTWLFEFKTGQWKKLGPALEGIYGNSMTAYDPGTGHVWEQGGVFGGDAFILEFDPGRNIWTRRNNGSDNLPYYIQTVAIDPSDQLLVAVGGGTSLMLQGLSTRIAVDVWDLNRPGKANTPVRSGPADVENAPSPGFAWYPPGKAFVGWPNGGGAVYTLDPKTWTWTMHPPAADNMVAPPSSTASGGTFGRFQYVPSMGVFVLVNAPDQNVYLYKPDFKAGRPSPSCPPSSVTNAGSATFGLGIPMKLKIAASNKPTSYYVGGLPPGLSFDARTGIISGAPSSSGKYDVTVVAYNRCGTGATARIAATVAPTNPFTLASNGKRYPTLQAAADAAIDNDTINVDPGAYANYLVYARIGKPLTIQGKGGTAAFTNTIPIPNGKGIIVSDVPDGMTLTLNNLELSGAAVGAGNGLNGAAVRLETGNLVVANSYIHDNQNGILSGNDSTSIAKISNSVIEHNGLGDRGYTHGVYFSHGAEVDIDRSTFRNDTYGHHIKSRAAKTVVTHSLIDDGTVPAGASYDIDTPNGGVVALQCNSIIKNANKENNPMVTTGEEGDLYPTNSLTVKDNLFTSNAPNAPIIGVQNRIAGMTATVSGNLFVRVPHDMVGSGEFSASANTDTPADAQAPKSCGLIGANLARPVPVPGIFTSGKN